MTHKRDRTMPYARRCTLPAIAAALSLTLCVTACTPEREAVVRETPPPVTVPPKALLTLDKIEPVPVLPPDEALAEDEPAPQALRHLRTGQERFNEGLWADASAALERALQVDPNLVEARMMLARAAIQHGNLSVAMSHLDEAARLSPRHPAVHQLQGELALQQRKISQAIISLRMALVASEDAPRLPERVLAHLSLALALREEGYLTAAADQLKAYLDAVREPTPQMEKHRELREMIILYRGRAPALLGEIYLELGRPADAVHAFRRAVEESPDDRSHVTQFILALAEAGHHDEAIDRAARIVAEAAELDEAIELLEQVCTLSDRPEAFDEQLVRIAREQDDSELRVRISDRLFKRGQTHHAAEVLTALTESDPDDTDALLLLARLRVELGQPPEAAALLYRLIRASPATYADVEKVIRDAYRDEHGVALTDAIRRRTATEWTNAAGKLLLALCELSAGRTDAAAQLCRDVKGSAGVSPATDAELDAATVLLARIALQARDYQIAIETAESAISDRAEVAELHLVRARAYEALDEHEKAEAAFLEAFRMNRKDPEPLFLLAESIERRGEAHRCEELYRRILDDVDPRHIASRERLVRLLLNTRKTDRAREYFADFERLGQTGPAVERCRALMKLATSKAATGQERLDEYRADLGRINDQYPNEAATYLALAMSHEAVGEFEQALEAVEAALAIDPAELGALERKAEYQAKLLDFEEAALTLRQLLTYRPNNLSYHQRLVRLALAHGDLAAAARELRRLLDRDQSDEHRAIFVTQLVTVLRYAKEFDESVDVARKWLDEEPDDLARREIYLAALREAGRMDEAVRTASEWLDEDPNDPDARRSFLAQLIAAERFIEAQQRVLEWLAEDPDDLELNRLLIRLFWEIRDWDSAIETLLTGLEDSRLRREYQHLLGLSYRFAGRWDEAVELYRRRRTGVFNPDLVNALIEARRFVEAEKEVSDLLSPKSKTRETIERFDFSTVLRLRRTLARIYQLTDREMQAIQQLEDVFSLIERLFQMDPASAEARDQFVGINNDLGYTLADEGIRLDEAERMIRFAVGEEPLNAAFIDSLGWVFYKQGRFEEAIEWLGRAILLATSEDGVMYDHLADALYRAGRVDEARANWETALEMTKPDRFPPLLMEDERLHEEVLRKLEQLDRGEPVDTAPLAQSVVPPAVEPVSVDDDP